MDDLRFLAYFPFTPQARRYAKSKAFAPTSESIKGGQQRLEQALKDGHISPPTAALADELEKSIAHYAASRMILAAWQNTYAKNRVAVAESKTASDLLNTAAARSAQYPQKLAAEFGLSFHPLPDGGYRIPFYQYLLYTPRDIHFKLSNMDLSAGLVRVSDKQRIRILEEAVKKRLESAPLPRLPNPSADLKAAIRALTPSIPQESIAPSKIDAADFPPCIRKMLEDLASSINVPHSGRLSLAIYLIKAGLSDEQIDALFTKAPDYNKETTLYQVRHIRSKGYEMPACSTMQTYGLCIASCRCGSPQFYRKATHQRNALMSISKEEEKYAK